MEGAEGSRSWKVLRRLLPAWYRDRWGDALLRTHQDRAGGPGRARGSAFWVPLAWDVLLTALQTRWSGRPGAAADRAGGPGDDEFGLTMKKGGRDVQNLLGELRIILRTLFRSPGYMLPAVATLGLGIGVATTIFSLVNGALLQPLPFPDADELVVVEDLYRSTSLSGSMSVLNYLDLRESAATLDGFAAYSNASFNLASEGSPERVRGLQVTHDFLETLGVTPLVGRDFAEGEDRAGGPAIALVSHGLWMEHLGGAEDAVGRTMLLDGEPYQVAGVLPRDFWFQRDPRILVPFQWDLEQQTRGGRWLTGIARLRDGVTVEAARTELRGVFSRLEQEYPGSNDGWTVEMRDLKERAVGRSRTALYLLGVAAVLVLLIGCVNVANLMLVRAERRRREMAVRAAMGGGRSRIVRQFLAEGLAVTAIAGALGIALAFGGVRVLVALWGSGLPRADLIQIDAAALGFSLLVGLFVGVVVGLVPALRTDLGRLFAGLREGGRGGAPAGSGLQRALVGTEVALAVILVTGAGLLLNSAHQLSRIDPGVELEGALTFSVQLPESRYPGIDATGAYFEEALGRIGRIPGVEAAGISPRTPLQGGYNMTTVSSPLDPALESSFVEIRNVTPGFFEAAGIPLLEGRNLRPEDTQGGAAAVLISDALAEDLFPDRSPVGEVIHPWGNDTAYRIVGVVGSVRDLGLLGEERPAIYWRYGYPGFGPGRDMVFVVRTGEDPMSVVPEIRRALIDLDPTIPLYSIRTLEDVATGTLGARTLATQLFVAFGAMALLLSGIGIFGTLAYVVEQRTREIGIRMAVGAHRGEVVRMVVVQGLRLVGIGLVAGVAISLATGSYLEDRLYADSLLYEVAPNDVWTLVAVVATVVAASALAAWMPARRAAGVAPSRALREG